MPSFRSWQRNKFDHVAMKESHEFIACRANHLLIVGSHYKNLCIAKHALKACLGFFVKTRIARAEPFVHQYDIC